MICWLVHSILAQNLFRFLVDSIHYRDKLSVEPQDFIGLQKYQNEINESCNT